LNTYQAGIEEKPYFRTIYPAVFPSSSYSRIMYSISASLHRGFWIVALPAQRTSVGVFDIYLVVTNLFLASIKS
jgi:hypothetical protein